MRPANRDGFQIAIICALTLEADPVRALFDETYDGFGEIYGTGSGDNNTYFTGRIGSHHVVLCYLSRMGKASAASAAANLRMSYRNIELALLVGVCGGAPYCPNNEEIILGDVIISTGIVEYDFGRQNPDGFRRKTDSTETFGMLDWKIMSLLAALKGKPTRDELQEQAGQHLESLEMQPNGWQRPGNEHDVLFKSSYRHKHYIFKQQKPCICLSCGSKTTVIHRDRLATGIAKSSIHFGKYASADTVLKSGDHRDIVTSKEGVIAFEMEGAGVRGNLPCIIVKGVCDYADSHKNKIWQPYAAAAAASASKAFLKRWPVAPQYPATMKTQASDLAEALRSYYTAARRLQVQRISGELLPMERCYINMVLMGDVRSTNSTTGSDLSLFSRLKVDTINEAKHVSIPELFVGPKTPGHGAKAPKRILIHGRAGVGKTTICKKIMHDYIYDGMWRELFDLVLWIPLRRLKRSSQHNSTLKSILYDLYFSDRTDGHNLALELEQATIGMASKDRVLLILDGLDEVSQEWELDTPMHNILLRLLDHPRVIITSRPYGLGISNLESFDMQLETVGFTEKQVEAYIKMAARGDNHRANDIIAFVAQNEMIQHLARIPVQLDAVCYSWDRKFMPGDTPKTMTLLYEAITLKLWQKDMSRLQQLDASKGLTEDTIRGFSMLQIEQMIPEELRLLEVLAFTGMYSGLVEFSADDRQRLYDALIQEQTEASLPNLPESIFRRVSFLHTSDVSAIDSDQTYHFLHLTFQEFFAARYFVRHWMEKKNLECINLRQGTMDSIFTAPQDFLQRYKYSSRYDIMWRFTTGLLQAYPSQSEDPVKLYFDQLDSWPRDLLGFVHQRLLMHCLSEVAPGVRDNGVRARVEDNLSLWLQLESEKSILSGLKSDNECPEHLLARLLQRHSRGIDIIVISALRNRTRLSLATLESILPILKDDDEHLRSEAATVVLEQLHLPLEILEALFPLMNTHYDPSLVSKMVDQVCKFPEMVESLPLRTRSQGHVRLVTGRVLARQPSLPPGGLDALLFLLQDSENKIRAAVAEEVRQREPFQPAIAEAFIRLLNDEDSRVRVAAAKAWGRQGHIPPEARHALRLLLEDKDGEVKVNAAFALSRCQRVSASTLNVLVSVLKRNLRFWWPVNPTARCAPMSPEEQKPPPPEIVEELISLLQHGDPELRPEVAKILSRQQLSLTTEVQTILHDYSILRLYTDCPPHQAPPMPTSHQSTILRLLRDGDRKLSLTASKALNTQARLSSDILSGLLPILSLDNNTSRRASDVLSDQPALPTEIRDHLFKLLEDECSDHLMSDILRILRHDCNIPPRVIKVLIAAAKGSNSLEALGILAEQTNLPAAVLEEVLPILNSEDQLAREEIAEMVIENTQVLTNLPAKYWGALYKEWFRMACYRQISCILKDNGLRLDGLDGVVEVHLSRRQIFDFRQEIRKAQLELGIPADTLLPEPSTMERSQKWFMSVVPW